MYVRCAGYDFEAAEGMTVYPIIYNAAVHALKVAASMVAGKYFDKRLREE